MKTIACNALRAVFAAATLAGALLTTGCATVVQDDWHAAPLHAPLPARLVEIPAKDLQRVCGNYPGMQMHGCAIRNFKDRVCLIYTGPQPAAWLIEHERKHCAGFDHGPQPGRIQTHTAALS